MNNMKRFALRISCGGLVMAWYVGLGGPGTCVRNANVEQLIRESGDGVIESFTDSAGQIGSDFNAIVAQPVNNFLQNLWGNYVFFGFPHDPPEGSLFVE
ncbi:MAG: hypothetical protein U1D55_14785 [Phycisphaerae bacterium]